MAGLECEYGDNANYTCNTQAKCSPVNVWNITAPGTGSECQPLCPNSYVDIPQGKQCSPEGLDCGYAQGQCDCAFQLPVSMRPVWQCFAPPGCPEPRPRMGEACTTPGTSCDYGACTSGGIDLSCGNGGYWVRQLPLCPAQ